jgi:hypothetical protein
MAAFVIMTLHHRENISRPFPYFSNRRGVLDAVITRFVMQILMREHDRLRQIGCVLALKPRLYRTFKAHA